MSPSLKLSNLKFLLLLLRSASLRKISENQWKQLDETVARPTIPRDKRETSVLILSTYPCQTWSRLYSTELARLCTPSISFVFAYFSRRQAQNHGGWETTISIIDTNRNRLLATETLVSLRPVFFFFPILTPRPFFSTVSQFPRRLFPGRRAIIRKFRPVKPVDGFVPIIPPIPRLRFVTFHDDKWERAEIDLFNVGRATLVNNTRENENYWEGRIRGDSRMGEKDSLLDFFHSGELLE